MIDAAKTIKQRWNGIVRWHDTHIANGILEGINSLVQAAKAKARGYRTLRNLEHFRPDRNRCHAEIAIPTPP
jgi:transposase